MWEKRVVVCDTPTPPPGTLTYQCWYSLVTSHNDTLYDIKITANNIHGASLFSKIHSFYVSTGSGENTAKIGEPGEPATRRQGKSKGNIWSLLVSGVWLWPLGWPLYFGQVTL